MVLFIKMCVLSHKIVFLGVFFCSSLGCRVAWRWISLSEALLQKKQPNKTMSLLI